MPDVELGCFFFSYLIFSKSHWFSLLFFSSSSIFPSYAEVEYDFTEQNEGCFYFSEILLWEDLSAKLGLFRSSI